MRIDPEKFWMQADRWPLDVDRYVFLGRAVEQIAVAQLEPPEAVSHPLSERMRKSVDLARDRIAKEAAAGRLKTAYLQGATFRRLAPIEWATIDRKALFSSLFRFPGAIYRAGSFAESEGPMYVEAASLAEYLKFTVTMARAAEADYTLGRVGAERYSINNPPDILPPPGFMSIDSALEALTGDTQQQKIEALRRILAAGRAEAILQFWETGKLEGITADYWLSDEALEALSDNGVASVPEDPFNPKSFHLLAYLRVRPASQPDNATKPDAPEPANESVTENADTPTTVSKAKRPPSTAAQQAQAMAIQDLRRAIQTVAAGSSETLSQRQLALKTAQHLNDDGKFETLKAIISGRHAVSNHLVEAGLLVPFAVKTKAG